MLSNVKYKGDFLLLDADSRKAYEFVAELDRDWDVGPVSVNQVGDFIQVLFWEDREKEGIKKAIEIAKKKDIRVRKVRFK